MKVFLNSIPKSGTYLLASLAKKSGRLSPAQGSINRKTALRFPASPGSEGAAVGIGDPGLASLDTLADMLRAMPDKSYLTGHVPFSVTFADLLDRHNCRHILIVRDPRDVVLSLLRYVLARPENFLHASIGRMQPETRVLDVASGLTDAEHGVRLLSIDDQYRSIDGWIGRSDCCVVTFEELIGERGGGSREAQLAATRRILHHIGIDSDDAVSRAADGAFDTSSPTFHSGRQNSWRHELPADVADSLISKARAALEIYERCTRTSLQPT